MDGMNILAMAQEASAYTVRLRRRFHELPEAGPAEQVETMNAIERELDDAGVRHLRIPGGGVLGFIDGPAGGRTVLLRADIDALPIQESAQNLCRDKQCVSRKPGFSHACGHDAHIAMQLTEARLLKSMESRLKGSVILLFEEGEEGHRNIEQILRYMEKEDLLHIDSCYATHVKWDLEAGKVHVPSGTAMSGLHIFKCTIHGQAGHGSRPDLASSALDCFVGVYDLMQTIRMKHLSPDKRLTFSVGKVNCGTADNVIPDTLTFEGTIRYFDVESGRVFWREFKKALESMCGFFGCTFDLELRYGLLPSTSDDACRALWEQAVTAHMGADRLGKCDPWMASESFSYFLSMFPGVIVFTGIKNEALGSGANHHTPEFDIDESGLAVGVASAVSYVLDYLENPPDTSAFEPLCTSAEEIIRLNHTP